MSVSKLSFSAALLAMGFMASAQAADAEIADANYNWQGLYMGVGIGTNGSGIDVEGVGTKNELDFDDKSYSFSGFAGYNFTTGPWVLGVEANLASVDFDAKQALTGLGTISAESDWIASAGLRAGYAFDNLLIYGTAGLALSDIEVSSSLGGKSDDMKKGLMIGAGAEYAVNESWTVRAEAIGYAFSFEDKLAGSDRDLSFGHAIARLGVAYKF